jgi:hypothetical protein
MTKVTAVSPAAHCAWLFNTAKIAKEAVSKNDFMA